MVFDTGCLFSGIPDALPMEPFDILLHSKACRLEHMISISHATPSHEWRDQDDNG